MVGRLRQLVIPKGKATLIDWPAKERCAPWRMPMYCDMPAYQGGRVQPYALMLSKSLPSIPSRTE